MKENGFIDGMNNGGLSKEDEQHFITKVNELRQEIKEQVAVIKFLLTDDRKTYRVDRDIKCCWNCRHVFSRFNLYLSCDNHEEWVKEASVIPVGICDSFEKKGGENQDDKI